MKFTVTNKGSVSYHHQSLFLRYIDEIAPEVFADLSALAPLYEQAFAGYRSEFFDDPTYRLYVRPDSDDPLQVLFNLSANKRYLTISASELDSTENLRLKHYFDLKGAFAEFIARYSLNTEWLRSSLFVLLGKLAKSPLYDRLEYAAGSSWSVKLGKTFEFEFEAWSDSEASEDYEQKVVSAFKKKLKDYLEGTAERFKESGSKQKTKTHKFDNVKWLVYWTVKGTSKEEIIEMIKRERPSTMQETDLNEMFRNLKKYHDLPNRQRKKGKSTPLKKQ